MHCSLLLSIGPLAKLVLRERVHTGMRVIEDLEELG